MTTRAIYFLLASLLWPQISLATADSLQQARTLEAVPSVDLTKFVGLWHEIARFENKHQEGCKVSQATYTQKEGYIEAVNSCTMADGKVKKATGRLKTVEGDNSNAKLKVNFTPAFIRLFGVGWGDYWIIDLGANYEYAVVSGPKMERLWVLSREKSMSKELYDDIVTKLKSKGFDTSKLVVGEDAVVQPSLN